MRDPRLKISLPAPTRIGSSVLLERPVRDSKIVLDVRARLGNVVTYENTNRISRRPNPPLDHVQSAGRTHHQQARLDRRAGDVSSRIGASPKPRLQCAGSGRTTCSQLQQHRASGVARRMAESRELQNRAQMKCPKCAHEFEAQQNRAAKSRWANMTKEERAAEMSRIRKLGVKNQKRTARRSNDQAHPTAAGGTGGAQRKDITAQRHNPARQDASDTPEHQSR